MVGKRHKEVCEEGGVSNKNDKENEKGQEEMKEQEGETRKRQSEFLRGSGLAWTC